MRKFKLNFNEIIAGVFDKDSAGSGLITTTRSLIIHTVGHAKRYGKCQRYFSLF